MYDPNREAARLPPFYFIHIMKTAGTSFRHMLMEEFGENQVFPNDRLLETFPNSMYPGVDWMREHQGDYRAYRIVIGHHPFSLVRELDPGYRVITLLRDPRKRSVSMLNHYIHHSEGFRGRAMLSLLQDEKFISRFIRDYQTKVMCMDPRGVHRRYRVDEDAFDTALRRLRECAFVGLADEMERSCEVFDARFGTTLRRRIRRENVGRPSEQVVPEILSRIDELTRYDGRLYEEARRQLAAARPG